MANKFQKMFFNLSTISPMLFLFSIVWLIQYKQIIINNEDDRNHLSSKAIAIIIVGILGFLWTFYSIVVVKISKKKLEILHIKTTSVESIGHYPITIITNCFLPFTTLIIKEYNFLISTIIIVTAMLFLFISNAVWPNPILMICGYHFYKISNANGSNDLTIISTRKSIQDANSIKKVIVLWDYFMIEVTQ